MLVLNELRLRLRLLLRPRTALPVPVRLTAAGFVDFGGVVYSSFDDFVAALRRIRPKDARLLPERNASYKSISEVLRAFQVANVGTFLGFVGNAMAESPAENSGGKSVS